MTNLQCLNAHGYSNIFFKMELIKNVFGILFLLIVFKFGVMAIALSYMFTVIINYIVDALVIQKYIGYKFVKQLKDILLNLFTTLLMAIGLYGSGFLLKGIGDIGYLILQIVAGVIIYILLSVLFKNDSFYYILNILKKYTIQNRT